MKRHGKIVEPTGNLGATFNPAAVKHDDGRFILLVRSVPKGYQKLGNINEFDDNYTSHISLWEGDAPDHFELTKAEALTPGEDFDQFGAEDPRISKIGDRYYVLYTSLSIGLGQENSGDGVRIAMASTTDFKTYKKHGIVGPDRHCKAGTLFESKGKVYFMWKDEENVERTMLSPAPDDIDDADAWKEMWDNYDIENDQLLGPQDNDYEDFGVEPGAPPIEIDEGLLVVYSSISTDYQWSISMMLLDKGDPSQVIAKTDAPFLVPQEDYELSGDVNNVVFPCGALIDDDRIYVYYGGADTVCAVASEDMKTVRKSLKPFKM